MLIIVNPYCCGGKGIEKWNKVSPFFPEDKVVVIDNFDEIHSVIKDEFSMGERCFIAGGGDGTVNYLLNCIIENIPAEDLNDLILGAIGLGSSNDFHKPFNQYLKGIPVKINFNSASLRDIVQLEYFYKEEIKKKYFLINASIGITAEANYFFNNPDKVLKSLKRKSTSLSIIYAALHTIIKYRNNYYEINSNELNGKYNISNIGLIKNSHFSGSLEYPYTTNYQDGLLGIIIYYNLNKLNMLKLLYSLSNNKKFNPNFYKKFQSKEILLKKDEPFIVESDGEIIQTNSAKFSFYEKGIKVCQ